jgi:hypothetical protein
MNSNSIRISNLPPIRGLDQLRELREKLRTLIEENGGIVAEGLNPIFIPTNSNRASKGFAFVKIVKPMNTTEFLTINGRDVFIERAVTRGGRTKRRVHKRRRNYTKKRF